MEQCLHLTVYIKLYHELHLRLKTFTLNWCFWRNIDLSREGKMQIRAVLTVMYGCGAARPYLHMDVYG